MASAQNFGWVVDSRLAGAGGLGRGCGGSTTDGKSTPKVPQLIGERYASEVRCETKNRTSRARQKIGLLVRPCDEPSIMQFASAMHHT